MDTIYSDILPESIVAVLDKEIPGKLGAGGVKADGWMQLYSLVKHVVEKRKVISGDGVLTRSVVHVCYLVDCFVLFAYHYFDAFVNALDDDSTLDDRAKRYWQHRAIERLCDGWDHLRPLLFMVKDERVKIFEVLVDAAKPGKISQERRITVPYYSRHFELVSFKYARGVTITGVPIYDLESPWNWHVIWHEMAGHIVHKLEEEGEILKAVRKVHRVRGDKAMGKTFPKQQNDPWENWRNFYADKKDEIVFPWEEDNPEKVDALQAEWIAELIEDGYSVLCLGLEMLSTLQRVLRQHYESDFALKDRRHPPPKLRFDLAGALLLTMGYDAADLDEYGLDAIEGCHALEPIAAIVFNTLHESGKPSFVKRVFRKKKPTKGDTSTAIDFFHDLISSARRKFEENPERASEIADEMIDNIPLLSLSGIEGLELPSADFFMDMVGAREWKDLLFAVFQKLDRVDLEDHQMMTNYDHGNTEIEFNTRHGRHIVKHVEADHV